jgi:hypothetical protein
MKFEGDLGQRAEAEDTQVEAALKNFRESVHGWSEREYGRVKVAQPVRRSVGFGTVGFWTPHGLLRGPVMGWAMAGVLAVGAVSLPVLHWQQERTAAVRLAAEHEQQRIAAEAAARQAAYAIDDEELLKHVDEDIAQEAPDAMEPLASLMTDSTRSSR